ncbi:MAG TPA: glycosyltransferase family 2 protein [Thermoanaerobaculia bacterium]
MEPRPTAAAQQITAVIVHYGPWATTQRTLDSLCRHAPGLDVRIVDNGGEAVPRGVEETREVAVRVIAPGRNLGFGAACNLGAKGSQRPWLLFLNNDVEIVQGTLDAMAVVLERESGIAAVGPRLWDPAGAPLRSIGRAPTPRRVLFENLFVPRLLPGIPFFHGHHTAGISHASAREVETFLGAVILVSRSAFEAVGRFDEKYFFYAEESDLFERLRRAGGKIRFEPAARAIHHGGVASRTIDQKEIDRRLHEGLRLYARRFHGAKGERRVARSLRWGATLRWLLSFLETGPRRKARRRRYADIREMYR